MLQFGDMNLTPNVPRNSLSGFILVFTSVYYYWLTSDCFLFPSFSFNFAMWFSDIGEFDRSLFDLSFFECYENKVV